MYDFTITKREIIASISIVCILLLIGFWLSDGITESIADGNEIYNKAIKIDSPDIFEYGMRTNVGNAFVYGDLEAIDTVTFSEIGGEYIRVEKVEKRYERHEREVTKTKTVDGKEVTYTETEIYYSWDVADRESKHSEEVRFCGVIFPYSKIDIHGSNHITTINGDKTYSRKSGEYVKVKFEYYGLPVKHTGTIFTKLYDRTITDGTFFYGDMTIEDTVNVMASDGTGALIVFWIFWIGLICGAVYGFYYLDNKWLE